MCLGVLGRGVGVGYEIVHFLGRFVGEGRVVGVLRAVVYVWRWGEGYIV